MDDANSPFALTGSELATLRCLAKGISKEDIAAISNVKLSTIEHRIKLIREKLEVAAENKNMLVAEAVKQGILTQDEVAKR